MKFKLLLSGIIFLISAVSTVNGQIKKGSTLLGGSIEFTTEKNDFNDASTTSFNISPAVGKAIRDNLVVGVDLNFYTRENRNNPNIRINDKVVGGGFFIRKYATLGKGFYIFGQGRIGGGYVNYQMHDNTNVSYTQKGYNLGLNVYPGVAYSLTNRFQLEAGMPGILNVNYSSLKNNGTKNNTFSASTSLTKLGGLSIGFRVLLAK